MQKNLILQKVKELKHKEYDLSDHRKGILEYPMSNKKIVKQNTEIKTLATLYTEATLTIENQREELNRLYNKDRKRGLLTKLGEGLDNFFLDLKKVWRNSNNYPTERSTPTSESEQKL